MTTEAGRQLAWHALANPTPPYAYRQGAIVEVGLPVIPPLVWAGAKAVLSFLGLVGAGIAIQEVAGPTTESDMYKPMLSGIGWLVDSMTWDHWAKNGNPETMPPTAPLTGQHLMAWEVTYQRAQQIWAKPGITQAEGDMTLRALKLHYKQLVKEQQKITGQVAALTPTPAPTKAYAPGGFPQLWPQQPGWLMPVLLLGGGILLVWWVAS